MPDTAKHENQRPRKARDRYDDDDEITLNEVGEEHDFAAIDDDERDAADRRRDPLRLPH